MFKTILLVHGRNFKPSKKDFQKHWLEALRFGIKRDHPDKVAALDKAKIEFVYYGNISNKFLKEAGKSPPPGDLADRREALDKLKQYDRSQFNKSTYRQLPGYNPWMEGLADLFSGSLNLLGLSETIIEAVSPDMGVYWGSYQFGSQVREVFTDVIVKAMKKPGEICVIGHSLGTLVTYDVLWKLSHYGEYRNKPWNRKVNLWITLGSPLADETIKDNLKGAQYAPVDRYPTNIVDWINIAAEDDYISHDQRVAGDFKKMKTLGYVNSITDRRMYNLAVRNGKSNPHHGAGYLISPTVADTVAAWL